MPTHAFDRALLEELWRAAVDDPLALLLLRDMCLIADADGRAPIHTLALRSRNFFRKRRAEGKAEGADPASLGWGDQPVAWWAEQIAGAPLKALSRLLRRQGDDIRFAELWTHWTPGFRRAVRHMADLRLIEYFETRVAGGW